MLLFSAYLLLSSFTNLPSVSVTSEKVQASCQEQNSPALIFYVTLKFYQNILFVEKAGNATRKHIIKWFGRWRVGKSRV